MKNFESMLILTVLFTLAAAVIFLFSRGKTASPAKKFMLHLAAFAVALGLTAVHYATSPSEQFSAKAKLVNAQFIVMAEDSGMPYQKGVVLVPANLLLPSLFGKLAAVAPAGARLEVKTMGDTELFVTAVSLQDKDLAVLPECGAKEVHGVTLTYEVDIPACPAYAF
jgi:hypothetical protein